MTRSAEEAVVQALLVRAVSGRVSLSVRDLAQITGISKWATAQAAHSLLGSGRIVILEPPEGSQATVWGIPGLLLEGLEEPSDLVSGIVTDQRSVDGENAIPTMPFQLPAPKGAGGSWFETIYRTLTRAHSKVRMGFLEPQCAVCCDTGFYVQPTSIEYDRSWLALCSCAAGQAQSVTDASSYVPPVWQGLCLMCEGTGWVYGREVVVTGMRYEQVQRCHSCRRTFA